MAVPKRKTSKQRKHTRAANWKISAPSLVECPQCHEKKLNHRVCKTADITTGEKSSSFRIRKTDFFCFRRQILFFTNEQTAIGLLFCCVKHSSNL